MRYALVLPLAFLFSAAIAGERINHEGRILPDLPAVTAPIQFNTPEADAVIAAMQIFPRDNAMNEDISKRPVHANSVNMMAQISADLQADRRIVRPFYEMNFVIVPDNQPTIPINLFLYPGDSDPSPYPIPSIMPVEGWPRETDPLSLQDWQQDINGTGGDRHSIIVMPNAGFTWETWRARLVGGNWEAANGAKFNLNSNALRTLGFTSGDAAGLSMFAGIVRYDECERGVVEHAIRCIVQRTREEYIYPASHEAGSTMDPNVPAMGQRLRLKSSYVIPAAFNKHERAIAVAMKKYGCIVADNGNFFSISVAPDQRFTTLEGLRQIGVDQFEVVATTGPAEGPRSPGAPTANAGADQTVGILSGAPLAGVVTGTNTTIRWTHYVDAAHPSAGTVTFTDSAAAATTANFSAQGTYTLMLSADDGVHTVAYDAVVITVGAGSTPGGGGGGGGGGGSGGSGGADTDGDGFSDGLETFVGTSPNDATSTPFDGAAAGTALPLTIKKLQTKLKFTDGGMDGMQLMGELPIPASFDAATATLVLDAGGIYDKFTFDKRGKGTGSKGSAKLSFKAKKGAVAAQTGKFQIKLKNTDFGATLSDENMTGAADAKNEARTITVTVYFNKAAYQKAQPQVYSAKVGKSGRSK